MKIVLKPGETIFVEFDDSDGEIAVSFDVDAIRVRTDWPDSKNRAGTIYEEVFVSGDSKEIDHVSP